MDIAQYSMRTLCFYLAFVLLALSFWVGIEWTTGMAQDWQKGKIVVGAWIGAVTCIAVVGWLDYLDGQPIFGERIQRGFDVIFRKKKK